MKHFVRFAYLAVFSLTLTSPALAGDADGGIEVGTLFGVSHYSEGRYVDESVTTVALPAPGGPGLRSHAGSTRPQSVWDPHQEEIRDQAIEQDPRRAE